jgi:prephenate dehydrogenase
MLELLSYRAAFGRGAANRTPLLRSRASSALLSRAVQETEWPDERANARPAVAPKGAPSMPRRTVVRSTTDRRSSVLRGCVLSRCGKVPLAEQHQHALESPRRCPGVLLLYGEQRANAGIAGELELDGYQVHQASHAGTLRARFNSGEVDLVIFGRSPHRGLDVLRALRAGELAPGVSDVRVLWMGTSRETTTNVLRAFEAGADDVTRTPLGYAELLARVREHPIVTVIGLGLIGGSIARRLVAAGWQVHAIDPDEATREAASRDSIVAVRTTQGTAATPDMVVVAVPPEQTKATIIEALERWPGAIVTDVASVKQPIIPYGSGERGADLSRYLPGHPLAGRPTGGYAASAPELFDGAVWALCPTTDTPLLLAAQFGPLFDTLGAVALVCTAEAHDRAVARTSHLPHLVATALAASNLIEPAAMNATLSGGGLRDTSRVAAADMELWWDILRANRYELAQAVADFEDILFRLKGAIASGDESAAAAIWKQGQDAQALITKCRWSERQFAAIGQPIIDGWGPWRSLGDNGRVLRMIRIDGDNLRAEVSCRPDWQPA